MTDWQIVIEDKDFSDPSPADPERPGGSIPWRWLLFGAALATVLFVLGWTIIREQRQRGQANLRTDLTAVIFEEETLRANQDRVRAESLIVSSARQMWRTAYWRNFSQPNQVGPGVVRLAAVDFDGRCALVDVDIDGLRTVRTYCLEDQRWRRAPVPSDAWGYERLAVNFSNGVTLRFFARDEAFAEMVTVDLQQFFQSLENILGPQPSFRDLQVFIDPHDLGQPLVVDTPRTVILNSPWLVSRADIGILPSDVAVRLALMQTLLRRSGPSSEQLSEDLPGADLFLEAANIVGAMSLTLSPATYDTVRDGWQETVQDGWNSPFLVRLATEDDPSTLEQRQATAQLMADYIYRRWGLKALLQIVHQMPETDSWDDLFRTVIERPAVVLDNEALLYTTNGFQVLSTLWRHEPIMPPDFPVQVTLRQTDPDPSDLRLIVASATQAADLVVEVEPDLEVTTPPGLPLSLSCLPAGTTLEIEGRWLEVQRRLAASHIAVRQAPLRSIHPAPADTVAYLVAGELFDEQALETIHPVYPGTSAYLVARRAPLAQALLALDSDGVLHVLTPLSPTLQVFPLPVTAEATPHFLFKRDAPNCERSWFYHYQPGQGVVRQWLGPASPSQWVWRADQQAPLFFGYGAGRPQHRIYEAATGLALEQIGRTNAPMRFLGWHTDRQQVVATTSSLGETFVGLLDWETGFIKRLAPPYDRAFRSPRLSPDGRWLAHLSGMQKLSEPSPRVNLLNVADGVEITLIQADRGQGLDSIRWSFDPVRPKLAALVGPLGEQDKIFRPTQIFVVSPDRPAEVTMITQAEAGERLATPIFCSDGALLYRVIQEGRHHLRRQRPGSAAKTLLVTDQPFWPLGCPAGVRLDRG